MPDNSNRSRGDDTSAPAPLGSTDLPELENQVSDEAATDVRGGVSKIDAFSSPSRVKWELSEFDA